jgi:DNA repair exonuclease SbcCD ATPase subunit
LITFKTLRFKNFLSFGNQFTEIFLNRSKTTLIQGTNGSGKSSIPTALTWVLFGKTSRGVTKKNLINSINKKDCLVELEFESNGIQFMVRRGQNPQVFEIYENGTVVNQNPSVRDYQKFLEDHILHFNINTFTQLVCLGGAEYVSFMQLPIANRRQIIEDILDISIFTGMNEQLYIINKELKESARELDNLQKVLKEKMLALKTGYEALIANSETQKKSLIDHIKKLEADIDKLNTKNSELLKEISKLSSSKANKASDNVLLSFKVATNQNKEDQNRLLKEIKFFSENVCCPTCSQPINEDFRKSKIDQDEEQINDLKHKLDKLLKEIEQHESDAKTYNSLISKISKLETEISSNTKEIDNNLKFIRDLEGKISDVDKNNQEQFNVKQQIRVAYKEFEQTKIDKKELIVKKHYLDTCGLLLKDSGIRAKIISIYLPIINGLINKYLEQQDLNVSFMLNETFDETIKARFFEDFSYENFSAGERARIDFSILLTLIELAKIKNSLNTNLLFFDELFDSVFDSDGMTVFVNLLESLDSNVFMISHRPDLQDKLQSIIKIRKNGNWSQLE